MRAWCAHAPPPHTSATWPDAGCAGVLCCALCMPSVGLPEFHTDSIREIAINPAERHLVLSGGE